MILHFVFKNQKKQLRKFRYRNLTKISYVNQILKPAYKNVEIATVKLFEA